MAPWESIRTSASRNRFTRSSCSWRAPCSPGATGNRCRGVCLFKGPARPGRLRRMPETKDKSRISTSPPLGTKQPWECGFQNAECRINSLPAASRQRGNLKATGTTPERRRHRASIPHNIPEKAAGAATNKSPGHRRRDTGDEKALHGVLTRRGNPRECIPHRPPPSAHPAFAALRGYRYRGQSSA